MTEVYWVTDEGLEQTVRQLLSVGSPEKIIVFGSRARGDARSFSDLDLLVIDPDASRENWNRYYRALQFLEVDLDLVVRTPQEVDSWRNVPAHFLTTVLREGRVLYDRGTAQIRDSAPPREPYEVARFWIRIGDRDLRDAETLLRGGGSPQGICFYAQQAIEKYLKGVIEYHGEPGPKTHRLDLLRELAAQSPAKIQINPAVDELSKYATNGRYREDPPADEELAKRAIESAKAARAVVIAALPADASR
jgi:HEPN domain-containing protein/predicted nucleotidyltransferase